MAPIFELVFISVSQAIDVCTSGSAEIVLPSGAVQRLKDFCESGWHIWSAKHGWIGPFQSQSKAFDFIEVMKEKS